MRQIVGQVIGRFIVGMPLNREQAWHQASVDHAMGVVMFSFWLRQFPKFLRPFVAPFLPYKRQLDNSKRGIEQAVRPMVEYWSSQHVQPMLPASESGRLVQWLLKKYIANGTPQSAWLSKIVRDHNTICFAAIHGPRFLLEHTLIDLASYPQYLARLREEIDDELSRAPFERWTRETVSRLTFVDAFCKESARTNPMGLREYSGASLLVEFGLIMKVAWLRETHQPITLSTGQVIPPDTLIAGMNPLFNPSAFPWIENPETFLPDRWMKDRSDNRLDASFRFGSATLDSLIFSVGRHACPGREFGAAIVKAVFAYIVTHWDLRLGDGRTERPKNLYMDFQVVPPVPPMGDVFLEVKSRQEAL